MEAFCDPPTPVPYLGSPGLSWAEVGEGGGPAGTGQTARAAGHVGCVAVPGWLARPVFLIDQQGREAQG